MMDVVRVDDLAEETIPQSLSRDTIDRPTMVDFFAGSGLVSEALHPFFRTIWANDIDPKKAKVYCRNHPYATFDTGSIEDLHGSNVPSSTLSWGSFPCQDLSLAGKRTGISSPRSGLVWQWLRVMDEMSGRPPLVVAENVLGLVSMHNGDHYRRLHVALVDRGYRVGAMVLDAAHWLPQSRRRVFIVAIDEHIQVPDSLESTQPLWCHPKPIRDISSGLPGWIYWNLPTPSMRTERLHDVVEWEAPFDDDKRSRHNISLIPSAHRARLESEAVANLSVFTGYKRRRNGQQVLELRFDDMAGCLRTPQGGSSRQVLVLRTEDGLKTRLLTIRELARLMGAPDSYEIPGSYNDAYRALGDAVAVPVCHFLGEALLEPLAHMCMKEQSPCLTAL